MNTDQEIVHEFIEKRPSPRLIEELHSALLDRQVEYVLGELRRTKHIDGLMLPNVSTIHTVKDGYFASLGVSSPSDLATDNMGQLMRMVVGNQFLDVVMRRSTDGLRTNVGMKIGVGSLWYANVGNCSVQLGSGITPVARGDWKIETPLLTAPESAKVGFTSPLAGYGSGAVTLIETVGPFGATETVKEGAFFVNGFSFGIGTFDFCYLRYNYSPTIVAFGSTAVTSTTINI